MPRTIVTAADFAAARSAPRGRLEGGAPSPATGRASAPEPDGYKERLLKYIPVEVVAVGTSLAKVIEGFAGQNLRPISLFGLSVSQADAAQWLVFLVLLFATPLYLTRVAVVTKRTQVAISTVAFVVWAYSLGGPFNSAPLSIHSELFAAILLPLFTFLIPLVEPKG